MTDPVRPPRDGGNEWTQFGDHVDRVEPDPDDVRSYEVLYANGQRVTGTLKHHENRRNQGYRPCWWRLAGIPAPALPPVPSEPEAKLNKPTDDGDWQVVASRWGHTVSPEAMVKYAGGDCPKGHHGLSSMRHAREVKAQWFYVVPDEDDKPALTGSASNYYLVHVNVPARATSQPYTAECLDLIEALGMTFNEGEAFKALWRGAAARKGNGKPGSTALYDAEKVAFYGGRMVAQAKAAP